MKSEASLAHKTTPRVTIVMTARERHNLTEVAIESIVRNTTKPFRFIYAESQAPEWLKKTLSRRAGEWGLEVVSFGESLWPNQLRKRILPKIDTDYAVFLDNDLAVEPGWLEKLVACADETGAGIVCPLYLIGDGSTSKIHMAGGRLTEIPERNGIVMEECHQLANHPVAEADNLRREKCDYGEFHCMFIRTKLAKDADIFDDRIVCIHEHIDTALTAKKNGYPIYLEPSAKVTYLALAPFMLADLAFFRERWTFAAAESSIEAFCSKWGVIDDERSFGDVRKFIYWHQTHVDPVRPHAAPAPASQKPMLPQEFRQTLSGLSELAQSRRYRQKEWSTVERAYRQAMTIVDGVYRPCGRPFINHLAGTASVLMHYDFEAAIVAAALLHAAYTHCRELAGGPQASIDEICEVLGGKSSSLERRVRAYTYRSARWKELLASATWASELSILDAEILAIAAANEVDMHLSGEFRFSGRRDIETDGIMGLITHVCDTLGVPGLAETLRTEGRKLSLVKPAAESGSSGSFRIVGNELVPAISRAIFQSLYRDGAARGIAAVADAPGGDKN